MRLDNFDLNLLVALDALLKELSVTRAAERLHVTQPAMSASLKRLREAFQDELLVQSGRTLVPTPSALALAPKISDAIVSLRGLISSGTAFDPLTSQRRFRLAASDYVATVVLGPLLARLEREAPAVQLDITLPTENTGERLAKGEFDLVLTPEEFTSTEHPSELLFEERHVVVGWSENPLFSTELTLDGFSGAGHVAVKIDGRNTFIENATEKIGAPRKVEVHAPSFSLVPYLLLGTTRIALMHERLARLMSSYLPLATAAPPFDIPPMREMIQFHAARAEDPGLIWLRSMLREFMKSASNEHPLRHAHGPVAL